MAAGAFLLAAILCGALAASPDVEWVPGKGWQKVQGADAKASPEFDRAFSYYLKGKYGIARRLFERVIKTGREPLVEEARILRAECLLGERHYTRAFDKFEDFLTKYPAGRFVDRAYAGEVQIAKAVLGGAKIKLLGVRIWSGYGFAEKVVDRVTSRRPLSDYAREAQIALARSCFRRHLYIESASAFQQYVEVFPDGPEVEEALLGVGKSLYSDARGPGYNPIPFYRAYRVFKSLPRDYPASATASSADRLADAAKARLAEHYYLVGRWYLKKRRLDSARVYFEKVLSQYGETRWADMSKSYLDALAKPPRGGNGS